VALLTTNYAASGTHTITASYFGDTNFAASTSASFVQSIGHLSNTTITTSLNPVGYTQPVSFTATVTGSGTPAGTITFKDGTAILGTSLLSGTGVASFDTTFAAAGTHTITASYGGSVTFGGSGASTLLTVTRGNSTTALMSSKAEYSFPDNPS